MNLEVLEESTEELCTFLNEKIKEFNLQRWEVKEKIPLALKFTSDKGELIAGAGAKTFGYWLLIDTIWVSESLRGQSMGSKMLKRLEQEAISRGCKYSLLDTLGFQAKDFYKKFGYEVQWTQNTYPKEGCKYFMVKTLN